MILYIVDDSAEEQARIARLVEGIESAYKDRLDLQVVVCGTSSIDARLTEPGIVLLGRSVADQVSVIASVVRRRSPHSEVFLFVDFDHFSTDSIRLAHMNGLKKVFSPNSTSVDILQELILIDEEHRRAGRVSVGRVIAITQPKGGIGATTVTAALSEAYQRMNKQVLLWDLDVESRDLSRALRAMGPQLGVFSGVVTGERPLTRDSFRESLISIAPKLSVLGTPSDIAAAMDLVGHPACVSIVHRILELSRNMHDATIIDTGGRLGAATGTMFRFADHVVLLVDETALGVSAACHYLELLLPLMKQRESSLKLLGTGTRSLSAEVKSAIASRIVLPPSVWDLPSIPFDRGAKDWAGNDHTLYSVGSSRTKLALEQIASTLLADGQMPRPQMVPESGLKSLLSRVLPLRNKPLMPRTV